MRRTGVVFSASGRVVGRLLFDGGMVSDVRASSEALSRASRDARAVRMGPLALKTPAAPGVFQDLVRAHRGLRGMKEFEALASLRNLGFRVRMMGGVENAGDQ